jgi:arylsulfatase
VVQLSFESRKEFKQMSHLITRRRFVERSAGIAGALAAAPALACADQRPNIILLMGDDHGWEETGYNGHPYVKTPVLDDMAETGLRMDNFYAAAPVCSPTRASVLTGRHPNRGGTFTPNWSTRPEEICIAETLGQSGYACGHFGKWHVGPVKADSPTNPGAMGFEEWVSHDNFFEMNPVLSRNGAPPERFEGESSKVVIDETIRFIGKAKQNQRPFFTVVWFGSPHEPYSGLEKDLALYADLPVKFRGQTTRVTDHETGRAADKPLEQVLQARFAEITAMDRSIGQLREYLKAEGLRQNTMLWYCGDNGTPGGVNVASPFRGAKGDVYEGGIRVPGVIEWPEKIRKQRATSVNGVTSDMFPTICELTGAAKPERPLDGISLQPLIVGKMTRRPEPICFWAYETGHETEGGAKPYIDPKLQEGTTPLVKQMAGKYTRSFRNLHHEKITERDFAGAKAILDGENKLVIDGGVPGTELFNLRRDRAEKNSLANAKPEVTKMLGSELRKWQESVLNSLTGADYR